MEMTKDIREIINDVMSEKFDLIRKLVNSDDIEEIKKIKERLAVIGKIEQLCITKEILKGSYANMTSLEGIKNLILSQENHTSFRTR